MVLLFIVFNFFKILLNHVFKPCIDLHIVHVHAIQSFVDFVSVENKLAFISDMAVDDVDDPSFLCKLIEAMYDELPAPKKK